MWHKKLYSLPATGSLGSVLWLADADFMHTCEFISSNINVCLQIPACVIVMPLELLVTRDHYSRSI